MDEMGWDAGREEFMRQTGIVLPAWHLCGGVAFRQDVV